MKRYNKPVVEINGFEVEDIITVSTLGFGDDNDDKAAYAEYIATSGTDSGETEALVFEW